MLQVIAHVVYSDEIKNSRSEEGRNERQANVEMNEKPRLGASVQHFSRG